MHRTLSVAAALGLSLGLAATAAQAKTCRDASGHFAACPAAPAKAERCRDASGHFAKCGVAAAPAPAPRAAPASRPTASNNGGLLDMLRRKTQAAPSATAAGRPASATVAAGPVTARCRDGSLSHSQHRSGTCAGHKGVASWM